MATKGDLIEAQNFSRRRLLTAFVSGAPGGKELQPSSPLRAVIAAIALTVIVVLVGVFYVRSYQLALRLHNEVPGIVVPDHVQARLRDAGPDAAETGLALAKELVEASRERASGVYVIPPFRQPLAALDLFG